MDINDIARISDLREPVDKPLWAPLFEDGCCLCGHVYAQEHRIKPGAWGGTYAPSNIIRLCPNHHAGIHLFMKWCYGQQKLTPDECKRLDEYHTDRELKMLFLLLVKPVVRQRLVEEGRWFPYHRTLPPPEEQQEADKKANTDAKWARLRRKAKRKKVQDDD